MSFINEDEARSLAGNIRKIIKNHDIIKRMKDHLK
jgi:hypothetical protein